MTVQTINRVLPALVCACLSACASTSRYDAYPAEQLGNSTATVHVSRPFGSGFGMALQSPVYVNNNLIGKLGPGGAVTTRVPAGVVRVRSTAASATIAALPDSTYYFAVSVPLQMWIAEPDFDVALVRKEESSARAGTVTRTVQGIEQPQTTVAQKVAAQAGEWGYPAEKAARDASCYPKAMAALTGKGAGFETYAVSCASGDVVSIRCEFGQCRALK